MDTNNFDWKPILTWRGRYRCANTNAIGYKPAEMAAMSTSGDPNEIVAYRCQRHKGKNPCESLATVSYKKKCYCEQHVPKPRT
jgi:hypothetical protein